MKKYFIYAASALALASCSSDDFLGENPGNEPNGAANTAILFNGNAGKITRATSNTGEAQTMLDNQFKVYGVKATDESNYQKVFENYIMWYEEAGKTTTNTKGWEYVGESSKQYIQNNSSATLGKAQTIKYWDYSSANYHFVAGSPVSAFTFAVDESTNDITSATITGLKGHITANAVGQDNTQSAATAPAPVYVAEPKVVAKTDYNKVVQFNFVRQQSKVRVGIYETIPGYKISEIKFYAQGATNASSSNVILTSATADYFVGTESEKTATGTITYDWSSADAPTYSFTYAGDDLKKAQNWYGGEFKSGIPATTSAETTVSNLYGVDNDMESTGYFTVMPTATATTASALLIKCDYTLTSEDESGETIKVTGATAAIPAAFGKWDVNTLYTYIFKISDNTNGTTGTDSDPAGLYPITFDAAVAESAEAIGTTTTVTTPSITTTQDGSVTENGIKYVAGKPIKVTVADADGTVKSLSTTGEAVNIKVFKLSKERTEADLQIASIATEELKNALSDNVTVENNVLSFTPSEAGTYAIQYLTTAAVTDGQSTPAVYTYKVVKVETAAN